MTHYRRLRRAFRSHVSLYAMTVAAPPSFEQLGRAVHDAGRELGLLNDQSRPAPARAIAP